MGPAGSEGGRPLRVLLAKVGLDGHDRGVKVVARALRDAGTEVLYTGLHRTPEEVASIARDEDVDVVGVSVLSGAHMTLVPRVIRAMHAMGLGDVPVIAGGIVPPGDARILQAEHGVAAVFGPGTPTARIVEWLRRWEASHGGIGRWA